MVTLGIVAYYEGIWRAQRANLNAGFCIEVVKLNPEIRGGCQGWRALERVQLIGGRLLCKFGRIIGAKDSEVESTR